MLDEVVQTVLDFRQLQLVLLSLGHVRECVRARVCVSVAVCARVLRSYHWLMLFSISSPIAHGPWPGS